MTCVKVKVRGSWTNPQDFNSKRGPYFLRQPIRKCSSSNRHITSAECRHRVMESMALQLKLLLNHAETGCYSHGYEHQALDVSLDDGCPATVRDFCQSG